MASVQGRYCTECKGGFYFFPITEDTDCLRCPCDLGGAFPRCDKVSGKYIFIYIYFMVLCNLLSWLNHVV